MTKPTITLNTTWACPDCGEHNNDKQESNDGIIDDLQCYNCDKIFRIYSKLQYDCLAYMASYDSGSYMSDAKRAGVLLYAVTQFNLNHSSNLDLEEMYQLYMED